MIRYSPDLNSPLPEGVHIQFSLPIEWLAAVKDPSRTVPKVEVLVDVEERVDSPWKVVVFNDEIHTFDEVIYQLVKATGCSTGKAEKLAWEIHSKGKAGVFEGTFEECLRVQGVLHEIQLVTEIQG